MEIEAHTPPGQEEVPVPISMIVMTTPQVVSAPTAGHWAFAGIAQSAAMPKKKTMYRIMFCNRSVTVDEGEEGRSDAKAMSYCSS